MADASGASSGANAAAAAAAAAAAHAHRLLLGGLLIELPADQFQQVSGKLNAIVVTGIVGSFFTKQRIYLVPYNGITFYCKMESDRKLGISAIEVPHIDKGPLKL